MPKKQLVGTVVSTKMDNTILVRVDNIVKHDVYEKRFVRSKKFYAHDEEGKAQVGDTVMITETRPISKRKSWILSEIL